MNSAASPSFEVLRKRIEFFAVAACLIVLSVTALSWFLNRGYTLYYGDAEAHLNIARRVIDSRTPGIDQLGTVWLPLPHLLMLPLVWNDAWWRSGLAGAVPSGCSFVVAGLLLYAAVRRLFPERAAALAAVAVFALNPNLLYLQSIPMTEAVFFAALAGLLFSTIWFAQTQALAAVFWAGAFSGAASLTRYEGWFLIPFISVFFVWAGGRRRWWAGLIFGAMASIVPLAWLAYNWWEYRNPLEFYNGPYSAKGIYERAMKAGGARQPGDHDSLTAIRYVWAAVWLTAGAPLALFGLAGVAAALWKRRWWPVLLLGLTPVFYIWSMYSGSTQIFVPTLWPRSYYNTRYGTTMLPLFALGTAALVAAVPQRFRTAAACALVALSVAPWLIHPDRETWVCWKESKVNSDARRAWTAAAGRFLKDNYKHGQGVFAEFGDLTGIYRTAGIPLRETLHEGNNPWWMAAERRPGLFLKEGWAVAFSGDPLATAIQRANRDRPMYELVELVIVPGADVVEIYRRIGGEWALPKLCAQHLIENCNPQVEGGRENYEYPVYEGPRR
jgi:hypothetical protein